MCFLDLRAHGALITLDITSRQVSVAGGLAGSRAVGARPTGDKGSVFRRKMSPVGRAPTARFSLPVPINAAVRSPALGRTTFRVTPSEVPDEFEAVGARHSPQLRDGAEEVAEFVLRVGLVGEVMAPRVHFPGLGL